MSNFHTSYDPITPSEAQPLEQVENGSHDFEDDNIDETLDIVDQYPNQNSTQTSSSWRSRIIKFVIVSLLIDAVLTAFFLLAVGKYGRSSPDSSAYDSPTSGKSIVNEKSGSSNGQAVPSNDLPDLTFQCTPEALAHGLDNCQEACTVAECCHLTQDDPNNCMIGNEDLCNRYDAVCKFLDSVSQGDLQMDEITASGTTATSGVNMCSKERIQSEEGRSLCSRFCSEHICCFQEDDNCMDEKGDECTDYVMCKILLNGINSGSPNDYMNDNESVMENGGDETYSAETQVDVCSPESIEHEEGMNLCDRFCSEHMCCFQEDDNCAEEKKDECKEYEACKILLRHVGFGHDGDTDGADEGEGIGNVDDQEEEDSSGDSDDGVCSPESIESEEGMNLCDRFCSEHMCCFQDDDNCAEEKKEECKEYAVCAILLRHVGFGHDGETYGPNEGENVSNGNEQEEENAPIDNDDVCSPESIENEEGMNLCDRFCSEHMCCFQEDDNCAEEKKEECEEYKMCAILLEHVGFGHDGQTYETNESDNNDVCSMESIKSGKGRDLCDRYCSEHICCFQEDDNCVDEKGTDECELYEKCKNLLNEVDGGEVDVADMVNEACSTENTKEGEGNEDCARVCSDHLCCVQEDDNCADKPEMNCAAYSPCEILIA